MIICDKCGEHFPFIDTDYYNPNNHSRVTFVSEGRKTYITLDLCPRCVTLLLLRLKLKNCSRLELLEALMYELPDAGIAEDGSCIKDTLQTLIEKLVKE